MCVGAGAPPRAGIAAILVQSLGRQRSCLLRGSVVHGRGGTVMHYVCMMTMLIAGAAGTVATLTQLLCQIGESLSPPE
jgi:hypothetical protein